MPKKGKSKLPPLPPLPPLRRAAGGVGIDDEGLITGKEQEFFNITHDEQGASQPLAGRGLVLGTDKEGESVAPSLTIEELRKRV